jgi:two-component system response regulator NreC
MAINILIVDDHGLFRAGLRALLENRSEYCVIGEAADGEEAFRLAGELQPDLVLMDISMPGMSGLEATRRMKEVCPNTRILALTVHEDDSMLREMVRAGASGYIIKRAVESDLINAIQVVSQGYVYVFPAMTRALFKDLSPMDAASQVEQETLTPREIDVLKLLARGHTNRQIAQELCISPRTVEGHRSSLVSKLGLRSRVDLINFAEKHGILEK